MDKLERNGSIALGAATVLVAISILLDGTPARFFNGVAGLTWFSAAACLAVVAWKSDRHMRTWVSVIVLTALVAFVVKPSAFVPAVIGFGAAGMAITLVKPGGGLLWAKLVVALYLPFHIGTAVLKAVYRNLSGSDASIRSEPPPTAAIVPIVMLAAAVGGALLAQWVLTKRTGNALAAGHR